MSVPDISTSKLYSGQDCNFKRGNLLGLYISPVAKFQISGSPTNFKPNKDCGLPPKHQQRGLRRTTRSISDSESHLDSRKLKLSESNSLTEIIDSSSSNSSGDDKDDKEDANRGWLRSGSAPSIHTSPVLPSELKQDQVLRRVPKPATGKIAFLVPLQPETTPH